MTVTSTHGAPILRAHTSVSAKRGIMGMESNVRHEVKRLHEVQDVQVQWS